MGKTIEMKVGVLKNVMPTRQSIIFLKCMAFMDEKLCLKGCPPTPLSFWEQVFTQFIQIPNYIPRAL
jgi:hypothetical protein